MDLWQLKIFCSVVELKSFSKAGEAVHISQPTVSSHIKDLEAHFGCRLIDRLSKEAVATKAGSLLYEYARRIIALKEETETVLAEFQGKIRGKLTVGGSTIPGGFILPQIIGRFSRSYPEVQVALINGDTRKIIQDVRDGNAELGIVGARSGDKNIVQEELIQDEMRLAVSAEHPWAGRQSVKVEELFQEPFIIREAGSGTLKSLLNSLSKKGYGVEDLKIVAEMGSTQAVLQGIKSGVGVSILSLIAMEDSIGAGTMTALKVDGLDLRRQFFLTRHRHRSASPLCKAFVEFIKHHCGPTSADCPAS
jgi:DNA-binding transcriptional LysR family regulator